MINHIGNTIIALSQLLHSTIMYITIMHELQSITIFAVVISLQVGVLLMNQFCCPDSMDDNRSTNNLHWTANKKVLITT